MHLITNLVQIDCSKLEQFRDKVSAHSLQCELKCLQAAGRPPHEPIKAKPAIERREMANCERELQTLMILPVLWDSPQFTLVSKIEQKAQNTGTRLENEPLNERSIFLWGCLYCEGRPSRTGYPEVCPHGSRDRRGHGVHRCGQPRPPRACPGLHQGFLLTFLSHSCWP